MHVASEVTRTSYLDLDHHWQSILQAIFRHSSSGRAQWCNPNDFCIVGLYANNVGNGAPLGTGARRLIVLNYDDIHFDPCLPL